MKWNLITQSLKKKYASWSEVKWNEKHKKHNEIYKNLNE